MSSNRRHPFQAAVAGLGGEGFKALSAPTTLSWLKYGALTLLTLWMMHSMALLFWAVWPTSESIAPPTEVINPPQATPERGAYSAPALEGMLGLGLFGDPVNASETEAVTANDPAMNREGIERGARESRLDLVLTGIVASTEEGLGSAVIEAKGRQQIYAVGDNLPANGAVKLAKVMAQQVVIDNNGTYELIRLFEPGTLASANESTAELSRSSPPPAPKKPVSNASARRVSSGQMAPDEAAGIAARYRDQLYNDPESLAAVVKISAVRGAEGVRGYRVSPGKDARQFAALGFEPGDVVTAVNGLALSDPSNTMRLYQLMRDASEATFEVERQGSAMTIAVSLSAAQ